MEVNAELYEFLRERETSLYTKDFERNKTVFAYVRVDFTDIAEFIEVVGEDWFSEGGMEVVLCTGDVCIEVNDIIESHGHDLSSYKKCFENEWENYEDRIKEMEA
ncbi:hypothetical protein PMSD_09995 [Paenibacillus macquariensis subsp. defensor]|nr:hypothetical protein PMSD_09995 [Paenibacillus macquariensis subsp. defensor]